MEQTEKVPLSPCPFCGATGYAHAPMPHSSNCEQLELKHMKTTPSREDWEKEFEHLFSPLDGVFPDATRDHDDYLLAKDFIRNLLQSHNNAIVAEIEKLKRSEENANASGLDRERNETIDIIIRIIQEK